MAVATLASLTVIGTLGYVFVEDASWLDALDMTVITLSTVGYGDAGRLARLLS